MERDKKSDTIMLSASAGLAVLSAAGIAVGTGSDLDLAQMLYSPDNVFWRVFTILGMYPFMALWVLYIGVICRQVRNSGLSKGKKTAWTVLCCYLGLSTSVICSWAMFASDTIGGVFPQTINNLPIIAAGALLGVYPLFFIGLFTSKKEYDKRLMKRLIALCVIMLSALYILVTIKLFFCRPRYRLLLREITGIEFHPWYMPFINSNEFISTMGIDWNDFRSFPSGHALQCMGLIFALPPLAEIYSRLNGKKPLLFAAGALFAVFVSISRLVMGAHFLSDVCAGSLLVILFAFVEFRFSKSKWVSGKSS